MEILTLNGKRYIKASKAAKDFGYATDYVGQLCRTGAVDAHLVGRTWYVNPDVLGAHRVEKKRNARVKAREYAKKSIEESKTLAIKQNTKSSQHIAIRYNQDEQELIPEVKSKRMSVISEEQIVPIIHEANADEYTTENKGKKIIMSGTVPVYDVEEETDLTDTTILRPRIIRQHRQEAPVREDAVAEDNSDAAVQDGDTETPLPQSAVRPRMLSFQERLKEENIVQAPEEESESPEAQSVPVVEAAKVSTVIDTVRWYESTALFYSALIFIILVTGTLFIETTLRYDDGAVTGSYSVDIKAVQRFLVSKI